jgi:hypothetical protein
MDFVNKIVSGSKGEDQISQAEGQQKGKSGGFMDKLNSMAGGGKESEKSEDALDKGLSTNPLHRSACETIQDSLLGSVELVGLGADFPWSLGVDWVQERVLGQGDQSNESATEQAKDEQISDFIRGQYKKSTGSDMPVKDKERF